MKKILSLTLTLILIALSATLLFSCADEKESVNNDIVENLPDEKEEIKNEILGKENNIKFDFFVTLSDGSTRLYKIETTKDNLGDALLEGNLIKGEEGEFGLYVTEVAGEVADWDKDNAYWYFYKNGEALMTGVSSTPIENGDSFEAKYTK